MSRRSDSFNFKVDPGCKRNCKRNFCSSLNLCEYGTVEGDRINVTKTTFYFNFDLHQAAKQQ